jgi:DNA-binding GntR family transcriptional regulator
VQLTEILQERIEGEHWAPGERFSSESELCDEFGVSRAVVKPALGILENNGLITRVKGKGTFISPRKSIDHVRGLVRDLAEPRVAGREIQVTEVKLERPDKELRELLHLDSTTGEILHAASLVQMDGRTVGFRDSFIVLSRVPGLRTLLELDNDSRPAAAQYHLGKTETTVETSYCTPFEAELFGIGAGTPTLLVRCLEYSRGPRVPAVEMARMVYRADIVILAS